MIEADNRSNICKQHFKMPYVPHTFVSTRKILFFLIPLLYICDEKVFCRCCCPHWRAKFIHKHVSIKIDVELKQTTWLRMPSLQLLKQNEKKRQQQNDKKQQQQQQQIVANMPNILNETTLISVNYFDYEMQTAKSGSANKIWGNMTHKNFTYKLY